MTVPALSVRGYLYFHDNNTPQFKQKIQEATITLVWGSGARSASNAVYWGESRRRDLLSRYRHHSSDSRTLVDFLRAIHSIAIHDRLRSAKQALRKVVYDTCLWLVWRFDTLCDGLAWRWCFGQINALGSASSSAPAPVLQAASAMQMQSYPAYDKHGLQN